MRVQEKSQFERQITGNMAHTCLRNKLDSDDPSVFERSSKHPGCIVNAIQKFARVRQCAACHESYCSILCPQSSCTKYTQLPTEKS